MNFYGEISIPQQIDPQIGGPWNSIPLENHIQTSSHSVPVQAIGNRLGRKWEEIGGPWHSIPSENHIQTSSHSVPVQANANQLGRKWEEFNGFSTGYSQEMQNCNMNVQNNWNPSLAEHSFDLNHIAFQNEFPDINGISFTELLACNSRASLASIGGVTKSIFPVRDGNLNQASRTSTNEITSSRVHLEIGNLILNSPPQVDGNWMEFNSTSLLLANQSHLSNPHQCSIEGSNLNQLPQSGYPITYRESYNFNSAAVTEIDEGLSSITWPFQLSPVTPDKASNSRRNQTSEVLNFLAHSNPSQVKDKQEKLLWVVGNEGELLQNYEKSSSHAISTPSKQNYVSIKNDEVIGLNRTPQQKPPRKRKHRPKVVSENKPKRGPKVATPKSSTIGETQTGKRKYVRKKGLKSSETQPAKNPQEMASPTDGIPAKSCRRALNFDLNSDYQAAEMQNQFELGSVSCEKSNEQIEPLNGRQNVQSQPAEIPYNLTTSSTNQARNDYAGLLKRHIQKTESAFTKDQLKSPNITARKIDKGKALLHKNGGNNGYIHMYQEGFDSDGLGQVVHQAKHTDGNNFECLRQLMLQSCHQSLPVNLGESSQARGSKRDYCHIGEDNHPSSMNLVGSLLPFGISEMGEYNKQGSNLHARFSESPKRKKIDCRNHTIFTSILYPAAPPKDLPEQIGSKGVKDIHANLTTPQMNYVMRPSYFSGDNAPDKMNSGHNNDPMGNTDTERLTVKKTPSTQILDFTSPTTVDNCKLMPPTPPKMATNNKRRGIETRQYSKAGQKNTVGSTLDHPASSSVSKVIQLGKQDGSCHHQISLTKTEGTAEKRYLCRVDEITCLIAALNLTGATNEGESQDQGALVPYKGNDGTIVPYETKRRKSRPKVDLDPETNRLWNLLMGKGGTEDNEDIDKNKESWWEEERRVFCGRADSFIARMHLVQGNRRFSPWKGSVVDSVIGVFLTQNVSDHLSSSAFMSLASQFPLPSRSDNSTCYNAAGPLVEEPEVHIVASDDTYKWHEQMMPQPIHSISSMATQESLESRKDIMTRRADEEIFSSQDSLESCIVQATGGTRSSSGSNSESEDPINVLGTNSTNSLTSMNLLSTDKNALLNELHNCKNESSLLRDREYSNQAKLLERVNLTAPSGFNYPINPYSPPHMQVPAVPSSKYMLHMSADAGVWEVNYFPEVSRSVSPTNCGINKEQRFNCMGINIGQIRESLCPMQQEKQTAKPYAFSDKTGESESRSVVEPVKQQTPCIPDLTKGSSDAEVGITMVDKHVWLENKVVDPNPTEKYHSTSKVYSGANYDTLKARKGTRKSEKEKKSAMDWDSLRKQVQSNGIKKERSRNTMDSMDYEALRCAGVSEISKTIKERGMNNMLAERMKDFLDRMVREHGSIDLEWLRDVAPDKAKEYLLSIRGLGLKSVECVRLLTLHHVAFPVDTNVGRIAVRLGWVPLQPLPESLQLHLLELYPMLESIQKYLWPRLCKLDQRKLYELHYQMITFGKVFCTKSKPNCNACPMRAECRHFASAFASARLSLPGPEEKSMVSPNSTIPIAQDEFPSVNIKPMLLPPPENNPFRGAILELSKGGPIVEEPATPEPVITQSDIEEAFYEDPDEEIPTIQLNIDEFANNIQTYMQANNMVLQEGDLSKALVALNPGAASIPMPKLKYVSRLRTEHQVYELPDRHPLLYSFDRREPDDPSPYLLAIWTPGETANSVQPSEHRCASEESGQLCYEKTCFSCNSKREANSQMVRGTILIPCRSAMRGSFPLNGTYFQVNEVFADHESSLQPIDVPREWIWNLPRKLVYFGTSVSAIFKGLTAEGIQECFWKGFVCVRGFERATRAPRPLIARLHFPASKLAKTRNRDNQE